ncbi:MAG: RNA 2',3'-cyclic phosphodiesterase [Methanobacteriota archaeon]|nr:MAG: RNA 2',3'-cyclic phosphodiesterase [Euryarchaeota archaeon]
MPRDAGDRRLSGGPVESTGRVRIARRGNTGPVRGRRRPRRRGSSLPAGPRSRGGSAVRGLAPRPRAVFPRLFAATCFSRSRLGACRVLREGPRGDPYPGPRRRTPGASRSGDARPAGRNPGGVPSRDLPRERDVRRREDRPTEGGSVTFRGFIAVDVPRSPALDQLAADLRRASPSLKVVDPAQVHLTVKFLGETEEGLVPEIVTAMREATAGVRPFEIRVRGTGAFPNLGRMNVLWVSVEGAEPIAKVADALEGALEALGFPGEGRPWKAHVTLARVKGRSDLDGVRRILESHASDLFGTATVDAVHLKKSLLTPQGARYSVVETVRLGT